MHDRYKRKERLQTGRGMEKWRGGIPVKDSSWWMEAETAGGKGASWRTSRIWSGVIVRQEVWDHRTEPHKNAVLLRRLNKVWVIANQAKSTCITTCCHSFSFSCRLHDYRTVPYSLPNFPITGATSKLMALSIIQSASIHSYLDPILWNCLYTWMQMLLYLSLLWQVKKLMQVTCNICNINRKQSQKERLNHSLRT